MKGRVDELLEKFRIQGMGILEGKEGETPLQKVKRMQRKRWKKK